MRRRNVNPICGMLWSRKSEILKVLAKTRCRAKQGGELKDPVLCLPRFARFCPSNG